jgi:hypothetical protein
VLAVVLLVLALRGVDAGELKAALADASYWWVVPLVVIALASHVLRAWRWNVIIASMQRDTARVPRLLESFGAVMVGYMVNYALPRLGEVARAGVIARRTGLSFAALIGTVAAERVLDVLTLSVGLVSTVWLLRGELGDFFASMSSSGGSAGLLAGFLVGGIGLATLAILLLRAAIRKKPESRVARLSRSFLGGLSAILVSPQKWLLGLQTIAIWTCYWFMAYIPLRMLRITEVYSVGLPEAWSVMNIGAIGVLIPSPGGLGSYHLITIEALTRLFGVHPSPAASYAVLTHGVQLVAYVISGVIALALFGMSLKGVIGVPGDEQGADPHSV